jgi:hypothetical protein
MPSSSSVDMRYLPSIVPAGAQNATALVLQDEMIRHLAKLMTMADWGAMLEEMSASKGSPLLVMTWTPTEVVLETNHMRTNALSLSTGSLPQPASRRN